METFARIVLEKRLLGLFIVPGLITCAGFHSRKDMDKTRMGTPHLQNGLDAGFFAECIDLTDELDFDPTLLSNTLGIFPDFFSKCLGEVGVIEYFDLAGIKKRRHPLVKAPTGKRALYDHSVIA